MISGNWPIVFLLKFTSHIKELLSDGYLGNQSDYKPIKWPMAQSRPVFWIRIRIGSGFNQFCGSRSASRTAKNDPQKKFRNFMFWRDGCSLLRAEGFSCSLNVVYEVLGIRFPAVNFFQFLVIKTLELDPDWYSAWNAGYGINEFFSCTFFPIFGY